MLGFTLLPGVTVHIKFNNENSADNPKLKFNGEADTNAKAIMQYGTTAAGKTSETNGWYAGAVVSFTYDGTNWIRDQGYNTNSQSNYGNITTAGKIGSGNNLVVTASGTVQAGAIIANAINTQTQSTRFLREDGAWATPSYTTEIDGSDLTGTVAVAHGGTGVTTEEDIVAKYGIEYIVGAQGASANAWTGTTQSSALYTGKTIAYKLSHEPSGNASLTLTFTNPSGNANSGAIAVYTNASRVTTHYKSGSVVLLTYDGTYWRASDYWNSNSRDPGYGKITPGAASTAVTALTANTTQITAGTYNEALTITPGNKWISLAGEQGASNGGDIFYIGHALSEVTAGTSSPNSAQTPSFNNTFNIPTITVDAAGHVTAMGTTTVKIPQAPVTSVATLTGAITASDLTSQLGLSNAMHFIGISTTALTNGGIENPTIDGSAVTTHEAGDVVIYNKQEYVWTSQSKWALLGDESSYALSGHTHGNITNDGKMSGSTASGDVTTSHKFLREDGLWVIPKYTAAYSLPIANYNILGGVKPAYSWKNATAVLGTNASENVTSVGPQIAARSTTNGRYYGIEIDKNGILFVNVPWTDHYNWEEIEDKPLLAGSNEEGGPASQINVTTFNSNSNLTQYLLYGNVISGGANVSAQSSLFIENTLSGDTINTINLGLGAARVEGSISLHSSSNNNYYGTIVPNTLTEGRTYNLPDASGTIALTTDIMTPASHEHGNIQNNGTLQTNDITIASGDKIVVTDASNSNKIARTTLTFDGSTTTKALTQKGTWEEFNNYVHPTGDGYSHIPETGSDSEGLYLRAGSGENSAAWSAPTVWQGICNTGASTEIKEVDCPGFPRGSDLEAGTVIFVYFNITNSCAKENIKLRINSRTLTDAKPIKYLYNADDPAFIPAADYLRGGQTYYFSYDGSNWVVRMNYDIAPYGIRIYRDTVSASAFNDDYPLLISRSLASSITSSYSDDIYATINNSDDTKIPTYNPYSGELKAPKFIGDITGNVTGTADVASKLGTSNLGTTTKPIYLVAGVATECKLYAGGTAVTLNGTSKGATTASFYAPTSSGTQYQLLVSGGSTNKVPVWTIAATLQSNTSVTPNVDVYTTLTLGNSASVASTTPHSEGRIILYSANSASHTINGATTSTAYTHTLPKKTGWIACGGTAIGTIAGVANDTTLMYLSNTGILTASATNVGSSAQPVYLASGAITAIEFTANRLYYTSDTDSFIEGTYYADGTGIAINKTSLSEGYKLEVDGKVKILNDLDITGNFTPTETNTYSLGTSGASGKRWSALYIGTADTYGSATQPIYWNNGVPTALTYTQKRLYYSESTTSFEDADCYCDGSTITINGTSAPTHNGTLQVLGTSIFEDALPNTTTTYDLGSSSLIWQTLYSQTISTRYIDSGAAASWSDKTLYLGYGSTNLTAAIKMYYSGTANTQEEYFEINNNGAYALTYLGVGGQNTSYNFYVNGTSLFGNTVQLNDDLIFNATGSTGTSGKISWSGSGDGADIYYYVPTAEQGHLILNTHNDANAIIAMAANDDIGIYFNPTNSTIYPYDTDTGTLGLGGNSAKRWSAAYIGTADTYGDPYLPIYWNDGVPQYLSGIVQYMPFTIANSATSVTLQNEAYNQLYGIETYVLSIVITSGENYLNDKISWSSSQVSNSTTMGQIVLSTAAVSGPVSGYIITARGCALINKYNTT